MADYRFTVDGKEYSFPDMRQAKVEAFRLTGSIGKVKITEHFPMVTSPPSPLKKQHRMTLVRWVIALLLFTVIGLAISTQMVVDVVFTLIGLIYFAWPVFVALAVFWGGILVAEARSRKKDLLEEEDY